MVNHGDLIMFTKDENYSKDYVIKHIGKEKLEECIDKCFFIEIAANKVMFTQKGQDFAWQHK